MLGKTGRENARMCRERVFFLQGACEGRLDGKDAVIAQPQMIVKKTSGSGDGVWVGQSLLGHNNKRRYDD